MTEQITAQVRDLLAQSRLVTEPLPQREREFVPVMSLMNREQHDYAAKQLGTIAVEVDGRVYFVQQTAYVPPTPRTRIIVASSTPGEPMDPRRHGMPVGLGAVGGG